MTRWLTRSVLALLFAAVPATASTFQIYEDSLGSPGVTAQFPTGSGLVADVDFDASSAEGGSLLFGASEIEIVPLGDAVLVAFACQLAGCTENVDYVFTAGGAGTGSILVSDPDFNPKSGIFELGDITWDSLLAGSLQLTGCNYTDANAVERTCDPFTLATTVPEPGTGLLLALGVALLSASLRGSRRAAIPRSVFVAGVAFTVGSALSSPVMAQEHQVYETNVSQFDGGGEPVIAHDPTNPQHLVAIDMSTPMTLAGSGDGPRCRQWTSDDGGQTWTGGQESPFTDPINISCEDPMMAAGPDGTFYVGGHAFVGPALPTINHVRVIRSTDGGATWSAPVDVAATDQLDIDNPEVIRPLRAWMFVDQSTGTAYVVGAWAGTTGGGNRLYASTDRGLTWSDHREAGASATAAHGVVATLFDGPFFSTSTDDGQTWSAGKPAPAGGAAVAIGTGQRLRADPSRPGRYAIMNPSSSSIDIWVTEDSGDTWSGPVQLAESDASNPQRFNPWFDYGPTGVLAVMWKTKYPDMAPTGGEGSQNGVFDAWAAVSLDGGHTFGIPIRLSSAISGAPPPTAEHYNCWSLPVCGDDFSYLAVDRDNVHVVWGDQRTSATDPTPAPRSMYYARIALDNCPLVVNPLQEDGGGINTPTPDGIGNACQCGDVTGNGIVNGQDGGVIKRHGLGIEPNDTFAVAGNCDVTGNGECNGQDANAVRRAALGLTPNPSFGQNCHNALGLPVPPDL